MDDVLSLVEADCAAEVGRAFVTVASEYMTQTRSRGGRVSTLHTAAEHHQAPGPRIVVAARLGAASVDMRRAAKLAHPDHQRAVQQAPILQVADQGRHALVQDRQQRLADAAGLALRTIQRVERGSGKPTGETLMDIASALNIKTSTLMAGSERWPRFLRHPDKWIALL